MTSLFKFLPSSKGNKSWSFRVTFAKDFLIGWGVIAGVIVTQIGVFNRCISYTRWGRVGLWLPMQPDAQTYLKQSLHSSYIIITCVGLGVVMFGPPIYIFWEYKAGLLVLMQRDDGEATFRIPNPRTWSVRCSLPSIPVNICLVGARHHSYVRLSTPGQL